MCVRAHSVPKEILINETMKRKAEVKREMKIKGEAEVKGEVASHSSTVSVLEKS